MSFTSTIKTILIVGATSGIGEQFARRFHALGKSVIITGRREDRLSSIKASLGSNVESYQWDITDFSTLSSRASDILSKHPEINAIFLVSGVGSSFSFLDPSASTEQVIIAECTTNITAQMLMTRIFFPHLGSIAAKGQPATFMLMGSGMGFVPLGPFPTYTSTKAAIHALALALRQNVSRASDQEVKKNLSVIEVVAPYVDTDFAAPFKNSSGPQPMPLKEYMDESMAELEKTSVDGKPPKEVAAGSAKGRVELWRGSVGKYMNDLGLDC